MLRLCVPDMPCGTCRRVRLFVKTQAMAGGQTVTSQTSYKATRNPKLKEKQTKFGRKTTVLPQTNTNLFEGYSLSVTITWAVVPRYFQYWDFCHTVLPLADISESSQYCNLLGLSNSVFLRHFHLLDFVMIKALFLLLTFLSTFYLL